MTHFARKSLIVCLIYGFMSITQTLNSRYLYRGLNFDYYSFLFAIQRIAIILVFYIYQHNKIRKDIIIKILPYSFFMCLSNILSSYCLTIMPLAAFLSFKKFIVLFVLILALSLKLPSTTNQFQNICIIGIVIGGAMVGQTDLLHGNIVGYLCCMLFNVSQSISLHYSVHLNRVYKLQPSQLLLYNCIISLPYYIGVVTYQAEFDDVYYFLKDHFSFALIFCLLFSIVLACFSELSSSYITMKISPFEKSTVSNIKDLALMIISVSYFHDFSITGISGTGILLCLISSILFSLPFLQQKDEQMQVVKQIRQSSQQQHHPEEGTCLCQSEKHISGCQRQNQSTQDLTKSSIINTNRNQGIVSIVNSEKTENLPVFAKPQIKKSSSLIDQ